MSTAANWPSRPDSERDGIEAALVASVCERGFAETTVEAVCERAGVERAAFETHFADLEDGYAQLFERGANELLSAAAAAFATEADFASRIRAVAHAFYRFLAEDRNRARFLFVEIFSAGESAQLARDERMDGMYELIDQGRSELGESSSMSRATAEAIGGGVLHRIRVAIEEDDLEGIRKQIPQLMYGVVLPYSGSEQAMKELSIPPPPRLG